MMEFGGFLAGMVYEGTEDICPQCNGDEVAKVFKGMARYIWSLPGVRRGEIFEGFLSSLRYKGWSWIGRPSTRVIDFLKGNKAISLKTFEGKQFSKSTYEGYIDKLSEAADQGGIFYKNGRSYKFTEAQLDIFMTKETMEKFSKEIEALKQYGENKGVIVDVFYDPTKIAK